MRKKQTKLTVRRETIRTIAKHELRDAVGGVTTCTHDTAQISTCTGFQGGTPKTGQ